MADTNTKSERCQIKDNKNFLSGRSAESIATFEDLFFILFFKRTGNSVIRVVSAWTVFLFGSTLETTTVKSPLQID